jgi:hypothetical protein
MFGALNVDAAMHHITFVMPTPVSGLILSRPP